jgi:hypothetical protein
MVADMLHTRTLMRSFLGATLSLVLPAVALAGNLRVTLVSATINGKRVKAEAEARAGIPFSDLACLASPGLRHLADACGVRLDKDGVTILPSAPLPEAAPVDPLIGFELGERSIRTYPVPSTLKPKWGYSFVLDEVVLDREKQATLTLYDYVDGDKQTELGKATVKVADLRKPGKKKTTVGPATVEWLVEKLPENASRRYIYSVPADQQIADLARTAPTTQKEGGYVAVPVAEGEIVEVRAAGQVQPNAKKYPERKAGPQGIATIATKVQFNQPGFRDGQNHAALIGQLGHTSFMVGERRKWRAETSGYLILAINDLKTSDNGGAFEVEVDVFAPAFMPKEQKQSGKAGGPAGLDPRVVQQIIDTRTGELLECAGRTKDPNGDIVLQIMVSADGRALVSVESASANLKDVGTCMADKASTWKFPPPRGTAVVRYPLHLAND